MLYDFDKPCSRRGTGCLKWDFGPRSSHTDPLPMWIADMDFPTPDFVLDGIKKRMEHPVFGYFLPDSRFYDAIIRWHQTRFGTEGLLPEHIFYQHSVLGSIAAAIEVTTEKGDPVLVQTPGYAKFKEIIGQHGRTLIPNPLHFDGNTYVFDYEDMEQKIRQHGIRLAILCSPHNPTGRVWAPEELLRYIEICRKYDVTVIADEIWSDFTFGRPHTPLHMVAGDWKEHIISLYSPTKTFNLAGLVISYAVIFQKELAERFHQYAEATHYNNCNALSAEALISAYSHGSEWVDRLNHYIQNNTSYIADFLRSELSGISAAPAEGTYLAWLDFRGTGLSHEEILGRCLHQAGLILNDGNTCLGNGCCFMRMNAATTRQNVETAMKRLKMVF